MKTHKYYINLSPKFLTNDPNETSSLHFDSEIDLHTFVQDKLDFLKTYYNIELIDNSVEFNIRKTLISFHLRSIN